MRRQRNAGDVDPDFNNGQPVDLPIDGVGTGRSHLLPDGKIVSVRIRGWKSVVLVRHLPDGTIDQDFGEGGVVSTPLRIAGDFILSSSTITADGKILMAGHVDMRDVPDSQDASYLCYVRLTREGQLDGSFGLAGLVQINLPNTPTDEANQVTALPDGKVVALAKSVWGPGAIDDVIFRLNANGKVDTTFGSNGFSYEFPYDAYLWRLQTTPDGMLLISGHGRFGGLLSRYDANGRPDTTFGKYGHFYTSMSGKDDQAQITAAAIQSDGRIVIAGSYGFAPQTSFIAGVELNGGGFDSFFNDGRPFLLPWRGAGNIEEAVAIDASGKILSLGMTFGESSIATLRRFNPNGIPDIDFGRKGIVEVDSGPGVFHMVRGLEIQPDGKYLASGAVLRSSGWSIGIYRFLP